MRIFNRLSWLQLLWIVVICISVTSIFGVAVGYYYGEKEIKGEFALSIAVDTQNQFELGLQNSSHLYSHTIINPNTHT